LRSFIALDLSSEARRVISELQKTLRTWVPRARWTRPEGAHLTLKFLDEITSEQQREITSVLERLVKQYPSLALALADLGAFPGISAPRVLWVGVAGGDELKRLQQDVEAQLRPLGFPVEKRPFQSHLTLARLEGERWDQGLQARYQGLSQSIPTVHWEAERLILFKSELGPGGAKYTPLSSHEFRRK
jgi:2'-5' RNA ligase